MPADNEIQESDNPSNLYTLGIEKFQAQQYDEAIECFNKLLSKNEWYRDVLARRGYTYLARHDYMLALNDFKRWIQQHTDATHSRLRLDVALLQLRFGQYEEAIESCNQIINVDVSVKPSTRPPAEALINHRLNLRARALYIRGDSYFFIHDLPKALNDYLAFQQEIKGEVHIRSSLQIGKIYFEQNQYSQALEKLNTIDSPTLTISDLFWLLDLRCRIYMAIKNTELALIDLERLSGLKLPDNKKRHVEQIQCFLKGQNITTNKIIFAPSSQINHRLVESNNDVDEPAQHGNGIYKSTIEGSSIELDGMLFQPATNEDVRNGRIANTRFFNARNQSSACLVVKREPVIHDLKTTESDQQYMNEAQAWNAMYPRYTAYFFEFSHATCRLALPRLPGIPLNTASIPCQQPLVQYLQIAMAIGLELHRLHELQWIHGDLKPDNIMLDFNREVGCYQPKLIDFGLSKQIGQLFGEYKGKRSIHIAPELYGPSEIPSASSADIYSFSTTILMCCEKILPKHLVHFLKTKGGADDPRSRPSITELMTELWAALIKQLSMDPDDNPHSTIGGIDSRLLIANFISQQEPSSFIVLMNAINQLDRQHQSQLKSDPRIANIIIDTYDLHKENLPQFSGFVQELLERVVESYHCQV